MDEKSSYLYIITLLITVATKSNDPLRPCLARLWRSFVLEGIGRFVFEGARRSTAVLVSPLHFLPDSQEKCAEFSDLSTLSFIHRAVNPMFLALIVTESSGHNLWKIALLARIWG